MFRCYCRWRLGRRPRRWNWRGRNWRHRRGSRWSRRWRNFSHRLCIRRCYHTFWLGICPDRMSHRRARCQPCRFGRWRRQSRWHRWRDRPHSCHCPHRSQPDIRIRKLRCEEGSLQRMSGKCRRQCRPRNWLHRLSVRRVGLRSHLPAAG